MIEYTTSNSKNDLEGILSLQKANLAQDLTLEELQSQGFVTVHHSFDQLKKLNNFEKHIVAKDDEKIVGYVLAMTQQAKFDIPILLPMFDIFENIMFKGKKVTDFNYIIVGQVCIDKDYRGKGIFDNCYDAYKKHYGEKYDFAITEIASTNIRSLNAHQRIGFKTVHSFMVEDTEWIVVLWDWKNMI